MHKTAALPLAVVYIGLIAYASLYPFSDWRSQGIVPWTFLSGHLPRYWSGFDVAINVVGYLPLGFLFALGSLRMGRGQHVLIGSTLAAGALSLLMECLQSYLPERVPSNVDLMLNILGGWVGAWLAWVLERTGLLARWSVFRARWFVSEARGGLVLLALWPMALLFPAAVPFGLGQVLERVEAALLEWLQDTPFIDWVPVREIELQPLIPGVEWVCVVLGLLIPCLLGFCIVRTVGRRIVFLVVLFATGFVASALSAALSYGPEHAWAWVNLPVEFGLMTVMVAGVLLAGVARRTSAALLLLALGVYLSLLNQAPTSPYFAQTLATWEQGRFIRFHGLAQWLGWLWPFSAVVYVLMLAARREPKN